MSPLSLADALVGVAGPVLHPGDVVAGVRGAGGRARRGRAGSPPTASCVVTAECHPDLFWALRGGGGNVGVVTAMQIELVELVELYGGGLFFPGEAAGDVLTALLAVAPQAPDEVSLSVALMTFPDLPVVPAALRGRFCAHVRVTACGAPAACEDVIAPVRRAATSLLDTVRTTSRATDSRSLVLHRLDAGRVEALVHNVPPRARP